MRTVLKLTRHAQAKEIEFELRYLKSLTTRERFKMCWEKSQQMRELLQRSGRRKAIAIIKRT